MSDYTIRLPKEPAWHLGKAHDIYYEEMEQLPKEIQEFHDIVYPQSVLSRRRPIEKIAYYFRREFNYDFVQYTAKQRFDADGELDRALYWTSAGCYPEVVIGAASLRWREWEGAEPSYALQWIWFHPYERNKGHLTRTWPFIRWYAGRRFAIESPISSAMMGFLKKQGEQFKSESSILLEDGERVFREIGPSAILSTS